VSGDVAVALADAWADAAAARFFANVWPHYVHEITGFDTDFYALDERGRWQPDLVPDWTAAVTPPANLRQPRSPADPRQPFQRAHVIVGDGRAVGFACVGLSPFRSMPLHADVILAELFVGRAVRGSGVAAAAVRLLLARYPGRWILRAIHDNHRAIAFWRRTLAAAPLHGLAERRARGDVVWRFTVPVPPARPG
jgi:predicted acetyltransferase